jgi:hypothetical protein
VLATRAGAAMPLSSKHCLLLLVLPSVSDGLLLNKPTKSSLASTLPWSGCGFVPGRNALPRRKVSTLATNERLQGPFAGPGAGLGLEDFVPFDFSFHDGYSPTACILDEMRFTADKFGKGKFSYNGAAHNVSIVRYDAHVPKEDREKMTHLVCFTFCRTVPDMGFFGLTNGRDCYCTPYFKQSAGDSSECDLPCDGALSAPIVCGGKSKSSVFEMHNCGDGAKNLAKAHGALTAVIPAFDELVNEVSTASSDLQNAAEKLQEVFGKVGDGAAGDLCQQAKVWAGLLEHGSAAGQELSEEAAAFEEAADPEKVQQMEKLTTKLSLHIEKMKNEEKTLVVLKKQSVAPFFTHKSADLYYPVMNYVDMKHRDVPSTCGGTLAAKPLVGDYDRCAAACENVVAGKSGTDGCIGFQWLHSGEGGACFLFSELKTVTYYTGCGEKGGETKCMAKMSRFQGTTLKPNPTGKCKSCLKEAKKADRCFEQ